MHETTSSALGAFDIAAILVVASALFGWANHHFIKLPHTIGLTVMGAVAAILLMVADAFIPGITLDNWVADTLEQMNFTDTLLQGMLSFLLFAGALHVDLDRLKSNWLPVLLLSTVGVIISTLIVGAAMWAWVATRPRHCTDLVLCVRSVDFTNRPGFGSGRAQGRKRPCIAAIGGRRGKPVQ